MEPRIYRTSDEDGCAVVRVEIANQRGLFATLDAQDYDAWIASGRGQRFILNRNGNASGTYRVVFYDRSVAGGIAGVAREILQPGPRRIVTYLDQDRLNLRRSNLAIREGLAKGQSLLAEADEPRPYAAPPASAGSVMDAAV